MPTSSTLSRCPVCDAVLLGVRSGPGVGSCPFCLPKPDTEKQMQAAGYSSSIAAAPKKETERRELAASSRKRVLVAEEARTTQDFLTVLLGNNGYEVLQASSGKEVLELAKTESPDLIVLGAELSELSGYDVYAVLKGRAACSHIPVLLLVAFTDAFSAPTRTLPAPEFLLSKPFTAHDLLQRTAKLLSAASSSTSAVRRAVKVDL
ncbi:MAG: response regulator [Planctomycetaceae bacterium]|nr:response regulator [Planctomycetaceae bacterium]